MAKRSSDYYLDKAKKHGLKVESGGKHWKISGTDPQTGYKSMMTIPRDLKGNGTEFSIKKWLVRMGVLFILGMIVYTNLL